MVWVYICAKFHYGTMFGSSGTGRQTFKKTGFCPPLPPRPERTPTASVMRFVATDSASLAVYYKINLAEFLRAVRPQMGRTCTPSPAPPDEGVHRNPYKNRTATASDMEFLSIDFSVLSLRLCQVSIKYIVSFVRDMASKLAKKGVF